MSMIKKNNSKLGSDVFYGNIRINGNDVMVSDLIKNNEDNTYFYSLSPVNT